ncbi:MAG: diadenylate cyclase [Phycisphaerae bacterium]|nr:diadenylate cyclase [Phycisphaerae bacterium]
MGIFERLSQLLERVQGYSPGQIAIELLVIGTVVYAVVRFVQGTRAAGAIKGLFLLLVVATLLTRILGQREAFQRLTFLYDNFLTIAAIALIAIFQPELRRGLTRLGEAPLFRRQAPRADAVVSAIAGACKFLSKARFGAIIAIEREVAIKGIVEEGTTLNAEVTAPLLQTIFFPGSTLHDLAVVISGGQISQAGVQLPLAEPASMPEPGLGSRHRAAVGLSQECDAIVVVVSEESGTISVAERGRLLRGLSPQQLEVYLRNKLERGQPAKPEEEESSETAAPPAPASASSPAPSPAAPGSPGTPVSPGAAA